jgi:hypothetical protein
VINDVPTAPVGTPASYVAPAGSPASTRLSSVPRPITDVAPISQPTEEPFVLISTSTASLAPSLPTGDSAALSDLAAPLATMVTHLRNNITKPHVPIDGTILYNPARRGFFAAPSSYHAALADD